MNILHQIVDLINARIEEGLRLSDRATYYCIADIVERDGRDFPVVKTNRDAKKVSPNSNQVLVIYHRITDGPNTEIVQGFGDNDDSQFEFTLKVVGFWKSEAFGSLPYTSRDAAIRVLDTLPASLKFVGDGVQNLRLDKIGNIELDGQVIDEEMPKVDKGRTNPMKVAAFSFECKVSGMLCGGMCLDGSTLSAVN